MPERAYRITLIPLPGGAPALVRLRQALMTLLRIHRLRCKLVEEIGSCDEEHNSTPARAREMEADSVSRPPKRIRRLAEPSVRDQVLRWLGECGPRMTRKLCVAVVRPVLMALLEEGAVERRPGPKGGWIWSLPDKRKPEGA